MRIKLRREEIEMSQNELSNILGYKDHSTISKIESGQRDFPRKKLMEIAVALRTSPAYLMGWENDKSKEFKNIYFTWASKYFYSIIFILVFLDFFIELEESVLIEQFFISAVFFQNTEFQFRLIHSRNIFHYFVSTNISYI